MKKCIDCLNASVPDQARFCPYCGYDLNSQPMPQMGYQMTTQQSSPPPNNVRRRRYRAFIPGIGIVPKPYRDARTGHWNCAPGCVITAILAVLLAIGGFLLPKQITSPSSAPSAQLAVSGNVVPGGSMNIHGSNFPPGSTVEVTVDSAPSAFHNAPAPSSLQNIFIQTDQMYPSAHMATVRGDGTFDTTVPVPSDWKEKSHHTIRATTQNVQTSTQVSLDVVTSSPSAPVSEQTVTPASQSTVTPTPTSLPQPTPTSLPQPTPTSLPQPTPTSLPQPTPTSLPQPTPTSLPQPTPTASAVPVPIQVQSITISVSPNPVCGYNVDLTYTAVFIVNENNAGGTIYYVFNENGGDFSQPHPITFNPGETRHTATFGVTVDGSFLPPSVYAHTTSPNAIRSATIQPVHKCYSG